MKRQTTRLIAGLLAATLLPGCALPYRASTDGLGNRVAIDRLPFGAQTEQVMASAAPDFTVVPRREQLLELPLLSAGDRVAVSFEDGDEFAGTYAVGMDGQLRLPYLPPVFVQGLTVDEARDRLADAFVSAGVLTLNGPRVGLVPVLWAAVQVNVAGAVYAPGLVVVNDRTHVETRPDMKVRSGDMAPDRYLAAAVRAAGGARPDADLRRVILDRNGVRSVIDLSLHLEGRSSGQPALMAGDRIEIPSTGRFQSALARPSTLTPPGFRIYVSNLSIPSPSNAASAVAGEATRLPNGSRLSHALASANCIGGTHMTNAGRNALLVSRNPLTGEVTSHIYRVYDVTRHANDATNNPYLIPEDAVACFDSSITVTRDLARTAMDILSPVELLQIIKRNDRDY